MILRKTGKLLKKVFAYVLVAAMVFTMLPETRSQAYIGAVRKDKTGEEDAVRSGTVTKKNGEKYAYLENDYIYFEVCIYSPLEYVSMPSATDLLKPNGIREGGRVGRVAHIVPQALLKDKTDNLDSFGKQIIHFQRNVVECYERDMIYADRLDENKWDDMAYFTIDESEYDRDYDEDGTPDVHIEKVDKDGIRLFGKGIGKYSNVRMNLGFQLVPLDKGDTEAVNMPSYLAADPTDKTQNWGVVMNFQFMDSNGTGIEPHQVPYYEYEPGHFVNMNKIITYGRTLVEFKDFPKTGHASVDAGRPTVRAQMQDGNKLRSVIINNGMEKTTRESVKEVFSDSYEFAAPFVAASSSYGYYEGGGYFNQEPYGIYGHNNRYPETVRYEKNTLYTMSEPQIGMDNDGRGLWGYRYLKTKKQIDAESTEEAPTEPDKVTMSSDSKNLYVVETGNGKYKVVVPENQKEIPKKYVAIYRGSYNIVGGGYEFRDGAVELSSTIKMTWTDSKANVKLDGNGNLSFDARYVSLNSPTFKFYSPIKNVATKDSLKFKGYKKENEDGADDTGITFEISPKANEAVVNINLPGNTVALTDAVVCADGNLLFGGDLSLSLFVASIDMKKLGYGPDKKGKFKLNGLEAEGALKLPEIGGGDDDDDNNSGNNNNNNKESSISILGFAGSKLEGDISTFPDNEHYKFEFELKVQNLFETEAMLNLVRLKKNGKLCPNDLSFWLKSEVGGIAITPATPAVVIKGGGGGIKDLAKTIDGDYEGIPPIVLSLKTAAEICKLYNGEVELEIGPSKLQLTGKELSYKLLDLFRLTEVTAGLYVNSKDVRYKGNNYSGYQFGGNMGFKIKLISEKMAKDSAVPGLAGLFVDTVEGEANVDVNTIVAERTSGSKKYLYGYMGMNGHAGVSFTIPVIDKKVLGAALDFSIGGESATELGGGTRSIKDFINGLELKGGIAATGNIGKYWGQVIYIFPNSSNDNKGKLDLDYGSKGKAKDIDWNKLFQSAGKEIVESREGVTLLSEPEKVTLENGEEAIAVVVGNTSEVESETWVNKRYLNGGTYTKQVAIDNVNVIPDGESLMVAVVPKDKDDLDSVLDSINTDIEGWTANKLTGDEIASDKADAINVWSGGFDVNEETGEIASQAVYVDISKELIPASGRFNITADKEFDIYTLATAPVTGLEGELNASEYKLAATITNPSEDAQYSLRTYYGLKDDEGNIGQDYLVDSRNIEGDSLNTPQNITLQSEGDVAPTGEYYVTAQLVDSMNVPVATYISDTTVSYTNNTVPVAPETVSLTRNGNERMLGTWSEVNDTEDYTVDGYRITIYKEDGEGNYVDTGRGYTFERTDLDSFKKGETTIEGLTYDSDAHEYSVDMAMTVNGTGKSKVDNGNEVEVNVEPLEAGKSYKIGVSAYTLKEVEAAKETEEQEIQQKAPAYGTEKESSGVRLTAYEPISFDISLGDKKLEKNEGTKSYEYVGNDVKGAYLTVDGFKDASGNDVSSEQVTVTVTKVGETDDNGDPVTITADENGNFIMPEFEGALQIEVRAGHKHDGVIDETVEYVSIENDDIAPVVTLEDNLAYADENGDFKIQGTTEAGVTVSQSYYDKEYDEKNDFMEVAELDENGNIQYEYDENGNIKYLLDKEGNKIPEVDEEGNPIEGRYQYKAKMKVINKTYKYTKGGLKKITSEVTSSEDGSFTVTGNLGKEKTRVFYVSAKDTYGNESDMTALVVSRQVEQKQDIEYEAPVAAKVSYNAEEQELVTGGSVVTGGALQYALGDDDVTVPVATRFTEDIPTGNLPGTYYVWYRILGEDNYNGVAEQCIPVTVAGAPVTVKADDKSKTYGEADPELTATVEGQFYDGDDESVLNYTVTREPGEAVSGSGYTITPSGDAIQGKYNVTYETGTLTINKAEHKDGEITGKAVCGTEDKIELNGLIAAGGNAEYYDMEDNEGIIEGIPSVITEDGKQYLLYRMDNDKEKVNKSAIVYVNVTGSTNYLNYRIAVTVTMENREEPTATPVVTEAPTATPVATEAPTATPVATEAPTATPVATETATPVATEAPTATPVATEAPTATPVATEAPTATPVVTEAPTATPVATEAATATPVATEAPTATPVATEAPTATPTVEVVNKITVDNGTFWDSLLTFITFGLYKPETAVTITSSIGTDADIYYYVDQSGNNNAMTMSELEELDSWIPYEDEFELEETKNVVYAKIVDKNAGKEYYICSDGIDMTPTEVPTATPVATETPTKEPTATQKPTEAPTKEPIATLKPTQKPTEAPTKEPIATLKPTQKPTEAPTKEPIATLKPTQKPTEAPTKEPTATPKPTQKPTEAPVLIPELKNDSVSLKAGENAAIEVTGAGEESITYSSSNRKVAYVKDGIVTALKKGTATITVSVGDKKLAYSVKVTSTPGLNKKKIKLRKGNKSVVKINGLANNFNVKLHYKKKILSVKRKKATLTIQRIKAGSTTVTITLNNGVRLKLKVK